MAAAPDTPRPPPPPVLHVAAVAAAALAAFALSLRAGFVWDDPFFVPENPRFAAVSSPLPFFGTGLWDWATTPAVSPLYRPMSVALMWALDRLIGPAPLPWHAAAVLLHAVASVLVYHLARAVAPGASRLAPLAAGLLFAAHPVHAEAVAWTTSAFVHPLGTIFVLLAARAQLAHARGGRTRWLVAAAALSTAALLTHEGTIAAPVVLVALWAIAAGRRPGAAVLLAAAIPLAAALALRAAAVGTGLPVSADPRALLTALVYTLAYARHLVAPWPQGVYLDARLAVVATPANLALGAGVLAGAAWLAWRRRHDARGGPALALAWIAASLAPLALAATNPRPLFAPRGLYLATVGLSLLAAWAVERLAARRPAVLRASLGALVAAGLAGCAAASLAWRDDVTVHERMIATDPESSAAHLRLGTLLEDRGEPARAREHLEAALRFAATPPRRAEALEALATHHGMAGRPDDAEPLLRALVAEFPARATGWLALGNVAFMRGELPAARARYAEAFRLDATSHDAAYNLALVAQAQGDAEAAAAWSRAAAALRPGAPARRP